MSLTNLLYGLYGVTALFGTILLSQHFEALTNPPTLHTDAASELTLKGLKTNTDGLSFTDSALKVHDSRTLSASTDTVGAMCHDGTTSRQTLCDSAGRTQSVTYGYDNEASVNRPLLVDENGRLEVNLENASITADSLSIDLDKDTDSVATWGTDGTTQRQLLTDTGGRLAPMDPKLKDAIDSDPTVTSKVTVTRMHGRMAAASTTPKMFYPATLGTPVHFLTTATTIYAVSSHDDDSSNGSPGAREVTIVGLSATYTYQTATVTLTGTTPASSSTTFIRIFRVYVSSAKTSHHANKGIITLQNLAANEHYLSIAALEGEASQSLYTVPTGYDGWIRGFYTSGGGATDECPVTCYKLTNIDDTSDPVVSSYEVVHQQNAGGSNQFNPSSYIHVAAKSDVWCLGSCTVVTSPMTVVVEFMLVPST